MCLRLHGGWKGYVWETGTAAGLGEWTGQGMTYDSHFVLLKSNNEVSQHHEHERSTELGIITEPLFER